MVGGGGGEVHKVKGRFKKIRYVQLRITIRFLIVC